MRVEAMIATVECFIHHRTFKEIRISKPRTPQQFFLLTKAYEKCKDFFIKI
tara:strand:- start:724 stop:876 length:153 start_codon:yes stop_codon:yes gene_type:complete